MRNYNTRQLQDRCIPTNSVYAHLLGSTFLQRLQAALSIVSLARRTAIAITKIVVKVHLDNLEVVQGGLLACILDVCASPVESIYLVRVVLIAPSANHNADFSDETAVVTRTSGFFAQRAVQHWSVHVPPETPCEPFLSV